MLPACWGVKCALTKRRKKVIITDEGAENWRVRCRFLAHLHGTSFGRSWFLLPSKFPAAPGYCYSDRLSFPGFRLSVTSRKSRPFSFLTDVLPSGFRNVRCPSSGIAPFRSFGGRSALVTFVRVALLLPSDGETVQAFTLSRSGKFSVAEASCLSFRR
jgi:hypothetical protein